MECMQTCATNKICQPIQFALQTFLHVINCPEYIRHSFIDFLKIFNCFSVIPRCLIMVLQNFLTAYVCREVEKIFKLVTALLKVQF